MLFHSEVSEQGKKISNIACSICMYTFLWQSIKRKKMSTEAVHRRLKNFCWLVCNSLMLIHFFVFWSCHKYISFSKYHSVQKVWYQLMPFHFDDLHRCSSWTLPKPPNVQNILQESTYLFELDQWVMSSTSSLQCVSSTFLTPGLSEHLMSQL